MLSPNKQDKQGLCMVDVALCLFVLRSRGLVCGKE